jgi:glyoxalase family protein
MKLEGLHHVTAICADAPRNVDFYARVLGLRLVKKTVNFDAPDVYHLYYGDEEGHPGSIMTFFEFPGVRPGRAGAGMVHTVCWRVGSTDALTYWEERLAAEGAGALERREHVLRFADPEGLMNALVVVDVRDEPLVARSPDVPDQHALRGFHGVRAYARGDLGRTEALLGALGFTTDKPDRWVAEGDARRGQIAFDPAPELSGQEGGGTVHHIAWSAANDAELEHWRARLGEAGGQPTPIIDRQYFHSVYFRTPMGVLFELATRDVGFAIDEPVASLGEALRLPPQYERLRDTLEQQLTPLSNPRAT